MDEVGLSPAHVAGLSWGGTVALEFYRHHSGLVASLLLIDTDAGWKASLPEAEVRTRVAGLHPDPPTSAKTRARSGLLISTDLALGRRQSPTSPRVGRGCGQRPAQAASWLNRFDEALESMVTDVIARRPELARSQQPAGEPLRSLLLVWPTGKRDRTRADDGGSGVGQRRCPPRPAESAPRVHSTCPAPTAPARVARCRPAPATRNPRLVGRSPREPRALPPHPPKLAHKTAPRDPRRHR